MLPTLLLVDDDEAFVDVLSRSMQRHHFEVVTALNVDQAVKAAQQNQPAYAVVDLRIGNESGLTVVEKLCDMNPEIRIVVLTGYASIATAVEAIKLGAKHYLTKPAEISEIIDGLHKDEGDSHIEPAASPMSTKRVEWEHLQKVLQEHDGNISAAARAMGMHRRTLQRKLQKKPVKH